MGNPVDVHLGAKLKELRLGQGMTQTDLASQVHLSFQQIQKYESGENRMSGSKLYLLASIFGVQVQYFFAGLPGQE